MPPRIASLWKIQLAMDNFLDREKHFWQNNDLYKVVRRFDKADDIVTAAALLNVVDR
jgi:hypothetical protein